MPVPPKITTTTTDATATTVAGAADGLQAQDILVDMPSPLPSKLLSELINLQDNVHITFSWATNMSNDVVRTVINSGKLPGDGGHTETAYRAKVKSAIFDQRATWLSRTINGGISTSTDIRKSDFTADTLLSYTKAMTPAPPSNSGATEFVRQTAESILTGNIDNVTNVHFWYALGFFKYDKNAQNIDASIQTFEITLTAKHYLLRSQSIANVEQSNTSQDTTWHASGFFGKNPDVEMIKLEPNFAAVQYEFDNKVFENLKPTVTSTILELARKNMSV